MRAFRQQTLDMDHLCSMRRQDTDIVRIILQVIQKQIELLQQQRHKLRAVGDLVEFRRRPFPEGEQRLLFGGLESLGGLMNLPRIAEIRKTLVRPDIRIPALTNGELTP